MPPQLPSSEELNAAPDKPHAWATSWEASGSRHCTVCGVEEVGLIRADLEDRAGAQTGAKSRLYHYRDAHGKLMSSLIPLSCPAWLGDVNGTVAETKQRLRGTARRVVQVEGRVGTVEERLAALEVENAQLRSRVESNHASVVAFASWLAEAVLDHRRRGAPEVTLELDGARHQLPPPVANLIRDLSSLQPEPVPVEVTVTQIDDDP